MLTNHCKQSHVLCIACKNIKLTCMVIMVCRSYKSTTYCMENKYTCCFLLYHKAITLYIAILLSYSSIYSYSAADYMYVASITGGYRNLKIYDIASY